MAMENQPEPFPGERPDDNAQLSGKSSENTAPMGGDPKNCKEKVMKNIRWVTALTGLGLVVAAIFSFLSSILSFSLSGVILCVYLCPIGIIISITETQKFFYARVIKSFPILRTHTGRGVSYIFIAGLTISVGTIACWIVGFVLLLEGICSIVFHYQKDQHSTEDTNMQALEEGSGAPTAFNASTAYNADQPRAVGGPLPQYSPANDSFAGQRKADKPPEPGSRSLSEVDSGADFGANNSSFGSTAAAAAFDYASNNPEKAAAVASAAYGFAKENPELASKAAKHAQML